MSLLDRVFGSGKAPAASVADVDTASAAQDSLAATLGERRRSRQAFEEVIEKFRGMGRTIHTEVRVVTDRVFLLGLDEMYRTAMKFHERRELLACARAVAKEIAAPPYEGPVEGYYSEDAELTEYFRLMRALQNVRAPASVASSKPQLARLVEVTSSPLFGKAKFRRFILPQGLDPLGTALDSVRPWSVPALVEGAYAIVVESDDFSLVGLACFAKDAVVITALRETMVLYALVMTGSGQAAPKPEYVWRVDPRIVERARKFVGTFNALFDEVLPDPVEESAADYFEAFMENRIAGRCVRIGKSPDGDSHYHWAIRRGGDGELAVEEFWASEIWTTQRYREERRGL